VCTDNQQRRSLSRHPPSLLRALLRLSVFRSVDAAGDKSIYTHRYRSSFERRLYIDERTDRSPDAKLLVKLYKSKLLFFLKKKKKKEREKYH